jgi:D-lactate dehydrogenase
MDLQNGLARILPQERILTRPLERYAYANDASYFRLIPQVVVQAATIDEIRGLFKFSQENRIPLTFRAAGTSLSGQAASWLCLRVTGGPYMWKITLPWYGLSLGWWEPI